MKMISILVLNRYSFFRFGTATRKTFMSSAIRYDLNYLFCSRADLSTSAIRYDLNYLFRSYHEITDYLVFLKVPYCGIKIKVK